MKLLTAAILVTTVAGFAPQHGKASFGMLASSARVPISQMNMAEDNLPFFAKADKGQKQDEEKSLEEEVEELTKEEIAKSIKVSKLRTASGVDYAPWMNISADDEAKIQQVMKEKAAARRKRQEQEKSVSGNLYFDSQAQELSGTGLTAKVIDGEVELEWATKSETNTKGFIVKKRPAKTEDFTVVASYENWGPLGSKGKDGGIYRFLDTAATPGGWVYRITECDNSGNQADLCQCLVEVQTEEEQRAALIAAVGIVALGVMAIVAGLVLDPYAS
mmetsp:Transcript_8126/g.15298  ORF Transcript_8126/g.15298 Transcript_8126/m.15298 type:complete len:275 (+) Transcript_8126:98-922(+)